MIQSYGQRRMSKPEGMLREIYYPQLCLTDTPTGDGRVLDSAGQGVRELPLTGFSKFKNSPGHNDAVITHSLDYVEFGDDGIASGWGWILDDDNGQQLVKYKKAGALSGNSVDLADITARYEWNEEDEEITIRFSKWNIAATTNVATPAFKDARFELLEDDELVASWLAEDQPLVMDLQASFTIMVAEPELTADGSPHPSWDLFHSTEPDKPHPIFIGEKNEAGYWPVFGHLALWDSCHDGYAVCTRPPRPADNYSGFNQPGVLTDRGTVGTGPIFLAGGHKSAPDGDYAKAYGGVENAWADVRIVPGKFGPWVSGYVRPGVDELTVIAARASRISGHWLGSRLKAIVSVNSEGFEVPGFSHAGIEFSLDADGVVLELVASYPLCGDKPDLSGLDGKTFGDDTEASPRGEDAGEFEFQDGGEFDIELELELQDLE